MRFIETRYVMIVIISCCWLYHDITFKCILGYTIIYDYINYIYICNICIYIYISLLHRGGVIGISSWIWGMMS